MLVDFLQNHFDDPGAVHDIIWSDGPLSVFKKKFMTKFFPWLSQKHERVFSGKYFLKSHGKGVVDGISGKTKAYFQFLKKLKVKGMTKSLLSHQIIFQKQQSSYCTNKTEVIHILQEEIFSRISEVIGWSLIKSESLGLHNNIHIVICKHGYAAQVFKHSGGEKGAEFSYKTNESIKSAAGTCILFTGILLILECMCFLRFAVDIFQVDFF